MITTIRIMELLTLHHNCSSKRQLAKKLGLSHGYVNQLYKGTSLPTDRALEYAVELELDLYQVLVGNLCEKPLISSKAKAMLSHLIGESYYRPKPDKVTSLLASVKSKKSLEKHIREREKTA